MLSDTCTEILVKSLMETICGHVRDTRTAERIFNKPEKAVDGALEDGRRGKKLRRVRERRSHLL